jgi:hypothetical protein
MDPELGSNSLDLTVSHYSYPHVRFSASIDYFYGDEEKEDNTDLISLNSEAIRQLPQAECSYQQPTEVSGVLPQYAVLPNTLQAEHSKHHIHPLSHHAKTGRIPSKFNIIQSVEASSSSSLSVSSDESSILSPAIISRHGDKQAYNFRRISTKSTVGSSSDDIESTASPSDFRYTIPQQVKPHIPSTTNSMSSQPSYYSIISRDSLMDKIIKDSYSVVSNPKDAILATEWTFLRVIGFLLIVVAFVELGIGAKIYHLSVNQKYGAWWAGFVALLGGFFAVLSPYHVNLMIAASLTISPAIVAAVVAAFTDGYAASVYSEITTCTRKADDLSFHFYGETNSLPYENAAMKCYNDYAGNNATPNDCVCVTTGNKCTPNVELFHSTDCSVVIDEYPTLLFASMGLCIGLFFLAMVGSIISCYNVWHKKEKENKVRIDLKKKRSMVVERGENGSIANM